ncbi:tRNA (adenosine(37)-N6)-threonylcarbamoyltransferase complex ATPase subunit type 1 TsaE [Dyella sp.]|jgi:tRNA threonylcarbamoyladenosine biosynthesis protein TsaE|uniref:tRNA (adenosine(37)-N6)-threonylcarbamoyltransferase complex ATPase subunit type 1 TsaE n=1 Tax=Dyella sp. TaxID=1869338 RepID=UPI002D781869|nr:tRNA (adenosine(37)-N6)-threonylcarbamoyltransferase complex ATPase subunit type 1 TsaE [Dyella sp.]HET6433031.1 tRNA (adenosine(37)-N6)-threonylcarbamoyltransferase complex ATPase subunit type 1 TsaE [Dyella sp.]
MRELSCDLADEAVTAALATAVGSSIAGGAIFHLHGDLGAGKTTFARALLQSLGVRERIKSPTYSLVESYPLSRGTAWHLDLYRIADADELEWLGIEALGEPDAVVLIEWPQHGAGALPRPDVEVRLEYLGSGRQVRLLARSVRGEHLLAQTSRRLAPAV